MALPFWSWADPGPMGEAVRVVARRMLAGPPPVDLHIKGFAALGAEITRTRDTSPPRSRGWSETPSIRPPSHTGTVNIMYALRWPPARPASSMTPAIRVVDLANLNRPARASPAPERDHDRRGVERLHPVEYSVMGDRLEAGTI